MAIDAAHRRFTVDDYHKMADAGILDEDERVELIKGEIIEMSPVGSRHAAGINRANRVLLRRLPMTSAIVSTQNPIRLDEHSEPQPDLAVLRYRDDFYSGALPKPEDVLLVLEISDSSLRYDRTTKLALYAAAGIPEAWLADLHGDALERHTEPINGRYVAVRRAGRGEVLASTVIDGLELRVDDVLG